MRTGLVAALVGFVVSAAHPAYADPVTYSGTLGKIDIVVELTDDPATSTGPLAGRYFYRGKGVDIPLQAKSRKGGGFELAEEEACGAEKCGNGQAAPIGAVWKLSTSDKGKTLAGSWVAKKSLPIKLSRVGRRAGSGADSPLGLYGDTDMAVYADGEDITRENMPYDHLRVDVAMQEGPIEGWPDASFRYVTDPRTKFARPRLVEHSSGAVHQANWTLQQRHWHDSIGALACAALQYRGFHDGDPLDSMDDGTLGGYEDSTSRVTALTPKLMSWRESGSVYCGGAHPFNYSNAFNMKVDSGNLLHLADIFTDVADGKPGPSLLDYVRQTREKPSDQADIDFEAECGTDELIGEYLAASFKREGDRLRLVFGLHGLPHAIQACGDDVLEIPVEDAAKLFKPDFRPLVGL